MSALAGRPFLKMNGLGNEIVVLDLRGTSVRVEPAEARAIARRPALAFRPAHGAARPATPGTDAFMRIYNTDGSESGACGNGTRCVAWAMLRQASRPREDLLLETKAGLLPTRATASWPSPSTWARRACAGTRSRSREPFADTRGIELQIGPIDAPVLHTPSAVSMGNPARHLLGRRCRGLRSRPHRPAAREPPDLPRARQHLARPGHRPSTSFLRVWERGAGLTRACGSAACAAVVAAARKDLTGRKVQVTLPGGDLVIDWRESDDHVLMTGPVELEHEGVFAAGALRGRRSA